MKLKQIGNNLLVVTNEGKETITFPKEYNFDKVFSLAYKSINGSLTAGNLLEKEFSKFRKKVEISSEKIESKKIKNKIKKVSKLNVSSLPITIPEDWNANKEEKHIKNFLLWLSLNDNEYTRNNFLRSFNHKYPYITNNGFIVSLRRVWKTSKSADSLYDFVQSSYVKVKGWKKSPKNYYVVSESGKYSLSKECPDVNSETLDVLYSMASPVKETTYCSNYNKNSINKETWKLGEIVEIHEKGTHTSICGVNQLHILSNPHAVLTETHYGDTIIVVLVNPKDVINIQETWKFTTSRMYIACELEEKEVKEFFNSNWGRFDFDYLTLDLKNIKNVVVKDLNSKLLNNRNSHLSSEEYKEILNSRIELLKQQ